MRFLDDVRVAAFTLAVLMTLITLYFFLIDEMHRATSTITYGVVFVASGAFVQAVLAWARSRAT